MQVTVTFIIKCKKGCFCIALECTSLFHISYKCTHTHRDLMIGVLRSTRVEMEPGESGSLGLYCMVHCLLLLLRVVLVEPPASFSVSRGCSIPPIGFNIPWNFSTKWSHLLWIIHIITPSYRLFPMSIEMQLLLHHTWGPPCIQFLALYHSRL